MINLQTILNAMAGAVAKKARLNGRASKEYSGDTVMIRRFVQRLV